MYTFMEEREARGHTRARGGGEQWAREGGTAEPGASVPLTMACGRVALALLWCMLVLASSDSMIVDEGNADKVSNNVKGQTHEHSLSYVWSW
jgi:hypothetical protein